jgi:hypothetical protein
MKVRSPKNIKERIVALATSKEYVDASTGRVVVIGQYKDKNIYLGEFSQNAMLQKGCYERDRSC